MTQTARAARVRWTYDHDPRPDDRDQVVYLTDVSWRDYERISDIRRENPMPRLTYLDGVLELRTTGVTHEYDKKKLARIFEAHVDQLGIPAEGIGSWTVKKRRKRAGAEADECYVFGTAPVVSSLEAPDLVIEVVCTSGGIDKLEVWRKLGAKEVWFWQRRELAVFVRRRDVFASARRSALVSAVDLELLARCMHEPTQTAAVHALRAALAKKRS